MTKQTQHEIYQSFCIKWCVCVFCAVLKRKTLPSIEMTDNNHATHSRAFVYKNYTIICNENILSFCLLSTIQFMQKVWFPLNFSCFAGEIAVCHWSSFIWVFEMNHRRQQQQEHRHQNGAVLNSVFVLIRQFFHSMYKWVFNYGTKTRIEVATNIRTKTKEK